MIGGRFCIAGALALVVLPLTVGCRGSRAERDAEAAVRAYNEALVVAYRTNDPRGLERVAGAHEVRKLTALIDLKRNGSLALESKVEALEILAVESSGPDELEVRTRERWRYWDRALKPGMPAGPVFVADLWMRWKLGREAGVWKILEGKTERSEYLEPKGFQPGDARKGEGAALIESTSRNRAAP